MKIADSSRVALLCIVRSADHPMMIVGAVMSAVEVACENAAERMMSKELLLAVKAVTDRWQYRDGTCERIAPPPEQTVTDWLKYDPDSNVITIDGYHFDRELFRFFTTTAPGKRIRILERKGGVLTLSEERSSLEAAAPDLLDALKAIMAELPSDAVGDALTNAALDAIAKAEPRADRSLN